ncbi:MAG: three-Cys-motif partner protein TcmP [Bryobacteraceae bacterium]|nr:three-Cys-motif partner protein TcmP [Bryobacteraceae bacterium]
MKLEYDEIGAWSEIKLEIVRKYAAAYSTIMAKQPSIKKHIYVDAFAGPGVHISRATGDFVLGSPLNALQIQPAFKEFHFIDADGNRTAQIKEFAGNRPDVFTYESDCNEILPEEIFPRAMYSNYARALCLLDPYNIDLAWEVVKAAGQMRSIEIFLNFMIMDANMNVLRHDPEKADPRQVARMNRFWGDDSWRTAAYDTSGNLFGWEEKGTNEQLVQAYRERLLQVAGFGYVPEPLPMRNSKGATVYYLFFASRKATGEKIVEDIFAKYRDRGV